MVGLKVGLKCEGNNKEGASDMLETQRTIPVDSMTQVLSHARKNLVCVSATCAWGWCRVYNLRRSQGNRHWMSAKHLDTGITRKNHCSSKLDACHHEEDCHHEEGCHPGEEELADGFEVVPLATSLRVDALRTFTCPGDLVAVELAHWDGVLCRFLILMASW